MAAQMSRSEFANILMWVSRALPARPTTPALAGIRLVIKDGVLTASAFDYEQSTAGTLPVTGPDMEGLVSGRLLTDVIKSLAGQDVTMDITADGSRLTLESGRSRFALPLMSTADYPDLPAVPAALGTVTGSVLADAVRCTTAAAGTDNALPVLTAISVHANPSTGILTLAATDRYRLATTKLSYTPAEDLTEEMTFLIPAKVLESYTKAFADADQITVHHGGDTNALFGVTGENRTATTRLLDGQFPAYEPLIPTTFAATAVVDRVDLIGAVRRVMLVAERTQALRLVFDTGTLDITFGDAKTANQSAAENIECDFTGDEEMAISFNPAYLIDGLAHISTETVNIGLVAPGKPALLTADSPTDVYRYLLMPTRA